MAFTFDLGTDVGKVRLLVPDRTAAEPLFEDEEIGAFLALEVGNVRRAAALALETIAADEALTLKVVQSLDLTTDGAKLLEALLKRAKLLRAQAGEIEADAEELEAGAGFEIAEMTPTVFAFRERVWKQGLRRG